MTLEANKVARQPHQPVLLQEFLEFFSSVHLEVFVDGTLGAGGHTAAILQAHPEIKQIIGIDQDPEGLRIAGEKIKDPRLVIVQDNFVNLEKVLANLAIKEVDGIFFDLGISSMQVDQGERGFSFSKEGPLDMRMDPHQELTAAEIINYWPERELATIFKDFGEERHHRLVAKVIVEKRRTKKIRTTLELEQILYPLLVRRSGSAKIHPATRVFQALRIAVNGELEVLRKVLPQAIKSLRKGGRLGVISFHSLEDRVVKNVFRDTFKQGREVEPSQVITLLTKKPVTPLDEETRQNPRSRSAKMRFIEKGISARL